MAAVGFVLQWGCATPIPAHGSTITANLTDATGNPAVKFVRFQPRWLYKADGVKTALGVPIRANADASNNIAAVISIGGAYDVYFGNEDKLPPLRVLIPVNDTNTWTLNQVAQLAVNAAMFDMTNIVIAVTGGSTNINNSTGTNVNLTGAFGGVLTGQIMTGAGDTAVIVSPFSTVLSYNADLDAFTFRPQASVNMSSLSVADSFVVSTPSSGHVEISTTSGNPYMQMRDVDDIETINIAGYNGNIKARTLSLMNDSIVLGQPLYGETYPGATIFGGVHWSAGSAEGYLREDGTVHCTGITIPFGGNTVNIDAGGTIALEGDLTVQYGTIRAGQNASFEGDGSKITGVKATAITGGLTTNLQFKMSGYTTNTLYFTNGILMRVSTP